MALPVLVEARALIVRGWCQRAAWVVDAGGRERWSLYGALAQTGEIDDEWARRVVRKFMPAPFIPQWNDDPRRVVREVVALLDRAIAECGGSRCVVRCGGWRVEPQTKEAAWKR